MRFIVESENLKAELKHYRHQTVPVNRRKLSADISRQVLEEVVQRNPVETGRSRAAWMVSLQELGGVPPLGWQGTDTNSEALSEGREKSGLSSSENKHQSEVRASNSVPYVPFLEYGTRKMSAFAMVRRSLAYVKSRLRRN